MGVKPITIHRRESRPITTLELEASFAAFLLKKKTMAVSNFFIGYWEADILAYNSAGRLDEYECKISRSDFSADAKKSHTRRGKTQTKRQALESGKRVNRYFYLCPEGLIQPTDLPDWAGLVYARRLPSGKLDFTYVRLAKFLNKTPLLSKVTRDLLFRLPYKVWSNKYARTRCFESDKDVYDIEKQNENI